MGTKGKSMREKKNEKNESGKRETTQHFISFIRITL